MDIYVFELASRFWVPDLILDLFLAYPGTLRGVFHVEHTHT